MGAQRPAAAGGLLLALLLLVGLLPPGHAASCKTSGQTCDVAAANCCSGLSCQGGVNKCYSLPRLVNQPCTPGETPCAQGLSCDAALWACLDSPRKPNQPCSTAGGDAACGGGYVCSPGSLRCVAPGNFRSTCYIAPYDTCNATQGLTCHPTRLSCFHTPRGADEPCEVEGPYACAEGLACERGITNECQTRGTKAGDRCHATRPCMPGLSCHTDNLCYNSPRQEGQPCDRRTKLNCAPGLFCDFKYSMKCVKRKEEGGHCWSTQPCGLNMTCAPADKKCYYVPRLKGDPCDDKPCATGLSCHPGTKRCIQQAGLESSCVDDASCQPGLTCHPGRQLCFNNPRLVRQPCDADHPCADNLRCGINEGYPFCL